MSKRKRNKWVSKIYRGKPCAVCGSTVGSAGDHIKTFGSGGECAYYNMWALCQKHHVEKGQTGLTTFVNKYPKLKDLLIIKGWEYDEFLNKWIRIAHEDWGNNTQ